MQGEAVSKRPEGWITRKGTTQKQDKYNDKMEKVSVGGAKLRLEERHEKKTSELKRATTRMKNVKPRTPQSEQERQRSTQCRGR